MLRLCQHKTSRMVRILPCHLQPHTHTFTQSLSTHPEASLLSVGGRTLLGRGGRCGIPVLRSPRRRQKETATGMVSPRLVSSSAVPYREGDLTYLPTCSGPAGERVWPVRERLPAHHGAAHAPGGDGRGAGAPQTRQPARQGHHHRSVRPNRVAAATTHIHIHAFSFLCSV